MVSQQTLTTAELPAPEGKTGVKALDCRTFQSVDAHHGYVEYRSEGVFSTKIEYLSVPQKTPMIAGKEGRNMKNIRNDGVGPLLPGGYTAGLGTGIAGTWKEETAARKQTRAVTS